MGADSGEAGLTAKMYTSVSAVAGMAARILRSARLGHSLPVGRTMWEPNYNQEVVSRVGAKSLNLMIACSRPGWMLNVELSIMSKTGQPREWG